LWRYSDWCTACCSRRRAEFDLHYARTESGVVHRRINLSRPVVQSFTRWQSAWRDRPFRPAVEAVFGSAPVGVSGGNRSLYGGDRELALSEIDLAFGGGTNFVAIVFMVWITRRARRYPAF